MIYYLHTRTHTYVVQIVFFPQRKRRAPLVLQPAHILLRVNVGNDDVVAQQNQQLCRSYR